MMRRLALLVCLSLSGCLFSEIEYQNEEVVCIAASRKGKGGPPPVCERGIQSAYSQAKGQYVYPDGSPARLERCDNGTWTSKGEAFASGDYDCCFIVRGDIDRWFLVCND